jgi:hypothetical protein
MHTQTNQMSISANNAAKQSGVPMIESYLGRKYSNKSNFFARGQLILWMISYMDSRSTADDFHLWTPQLEGNKKL